jgi:hypothetical protein
MAKQLAVRDIKNIDGRIFVVFSYGDTAPAVPTTEIDFIDEEDMKVQISRVEDMLGERGLLLLHLAITYLKQDGTLGNLNQVLNRTLNFDVFAPNPLRLT